MKILHTVEFYAPRVGGAERVVQALSEGLARRGHEVTVATSFDAQRGYTHLNGVRIAQFPVWGNEVKGIRGASHSFLAFLDAGRWDVVMNYAAQSWPTDLAMTRLGRLEAAMVLSPCGYSGLVGWRRPLYHRYFNRLPARLRAYDAVVPHATGFRDFEFGARHGVSQTVIPVGVDSAEFTGPSPSVRQELGLGGGPLVVSIGNHYRLKRHDILHQAMRRSRHRNATFLVIGGDPGGLRSCHRACLRRGGEGGWRNASGLPRDLVAAAVRQADILASPSRTEVFPLTLVEAMAAGTPFVAMDAGVARSLPGGIVCDTPREFTLAIDRLLDDPKERAELGQRGRLEQRARYDWTPIVKAYEGLYERVAA